MTKVLVTGGAGFIGSHLCEGLIARGLRGAGAGQSLLWPARLGARGGRIHRRRHPRSGRLPPRRRRRPWRLPLAAMSRSGPSQEQIELCTASNIAGTQNMLLAARDAGVKRFIYSGSSTYYGNRPPPHRESDPPDLLNIYGVTKRVGEQYTLVVRPGLRSSVPGAALFQCLWPAPARDRRLCPGAGDFPQAPGGRQSAGDPWRRHASAATSSMCATWWPPISRPMKATCAARCSMSAAAPASRSRNWPT